MLETQPQLLDTIQASQLLNVSARVLADRAWRARHNVPTVRVGGAVRFDMIALRRWLEGRREQHGLNA